MTLFEFDEAMRFQYGAPLCGTDEAGRGPLAGPVFAAAVILPPEIVIKGLNDSKKLTAARPPSQAWGRRISTTSIF